MLRGQDGGSAQAVARGPGHPLSPPARHRDTACRSSPEQARFRQAHRAPATRGACELHEVSLPAFLARSAAAGAGCSNLAPSDPRVTRTEQADPACRHRGCSAPLAVALHRRVRSRFHPTCRRQHEEHRPHSRRRARAPLSPAAHAERPSLQSSVPLDHSGPAWSAAASRWYEATSDPRRTRASHAQETHSARECPPWPSSEPLTWARRTARQRAPRRMPLGVPCSSVSRLLRIASTDGRSPTPDQPPQRNRSHPEHGAQHDVRHEHPRETVLGQAL